MRLLGFIVAASIGLALLQAAAKVAVLIVLIAGLTAFAVRPTEAIGCLLTLGLLGVVGHYPVVGLAALTALAAAGMLAKKQADE